MQIGAALRVSPRLLRRSCRLAAILICLSGTTSAQAPTVWPLPLPQLAEVAPPADAAVEMTILWNVTFPAAAVGPGQAASVAPLRNDFRVTARRAAPRMPARQRDPQLSEDDLVIVAVNAQGEELAWQLVKDPTLIRAETPTPSGELEHRTLRRSEASFIVTLPQSAAAITELRLFKPRWTGSAYALDPLGTVTVPTIPR